MANTVQSTSVSGVSQQLLDTMNPKAASTDAVTAQQDQFMKLLITQMQSQDPLNPMDNAQVTSQFAQLSTVTGINKLNETLNALQTSYNANQTMQAASMIGHSVFAPGSSISLSSGKGVLGVDFTEKADQAIVTIKDSAGATVRTISLGAQDVGTVPVVWDGKTDSGTTAADGTYTFSIKATRGEANVKATALGFGAVNSVTTSSSGIKMNVSGVGDVGMSDIREIM
jgi:flagellar basal-body rod modification protein FlgD